MKLEDLVIYQTAMEIGEEVWQIVYKWEHLAKRTIGEQVIRSSDSVASNISEGFGRYTFKERIRFCHIARGSLYETKTWLQKAYNRNLIDNEKHKELAEKAEKLGVKINNYINSLEKQSV